MRAFRIPEWNGPSERKSAGRGGDFNECAGKSEADGDITEVTRSPDRRTTIGVARGWTGYSPAHPFGSLAAINLAVTRGGQRPIALRRQVSLGLPFRG